jgi:lipoprotein NlpD
MTDGMAGASKARVQRRWAGEAAAPARTAPVRRAAGPVIGLVVLATVLAGCAASRNRAPVEDRSSVRTAPVSPTGAVPIDPRLLPGAENAGKPGYYTVKPGDTLIRIGLENGQNWRDVVRWNNLENPNIIEVGQVLRVVPPGADPNAATTRGVVTSRVEPRPLDARPAAAESQAAAAARAASQPATAVTAASAASGASAAASSVPSAAREGDDDIAWSWPAGGGVMEPFDDARHKGLSIGGKAGDPVYAAADGRVVYAGSGLRGYGNLLILKHNSTYLTAYAHNQTLLVKEDQAVRRGQKIAEMGATDTDHVQLHFEIRKQGKPIDPAKLLPAR